MKDLINSLKFEFVTDVVGSLTDIIAAEFPRRYPRLLKYWRQNHFTLVPVPLHLSRQNWRGFNQSALVASAMAAKLKLNYVPDLLIRTKNTVPQTSLRDKSVRRSNVTSAFKFTGQKWLSDKFANFILVDDVYTTGSTIKAAASDMPADSRLWILTLA